MGVAVDLEMFDVVHGERYDDNYPWLHCNHCNWGIARIHPGMTISDLISMSSRHTHAQ
jgi:hypothetical protein